MRLRKYLTVLAATVILSGGIAASAAENSAVGSERRTTNSAEEPTFTPAKQEPLKLPKKPFSNENSCAEVKKNLDEYQKRGKKYALCVREQTPQERADHPAPQSSQGPGTVWCDSLPKQNVYVTRTEICLEGDFTVDIWQVPGGGLVGQAFGETKQEITTSKSSTEFGEYFYVRVNDATGVALGKLELAIDSDCAPACTTHSKPWTGYTPATIGVGLDGTFARSWSNTSGSNDMLMGYRLDVKFNNGAELANYEWSAGGHVKVRCDNLITAVAGCIVPSFPPTFTVNHEKYPAASDYIYDAQAVIKTHPGKQYSDGTGNPLHREGNEATAKANRKIVCDSSFEIEDRYNGKYQIQCDEYPFAATKESGGQLGISDGKTCWKFTAHPAGVANPIDHTMFALRDPWGTSHCARASMPKPQNEGVGGDLGRFVQSQRLLDNDAYWVKATSTVS